ncbi:MAG: hypothetical protein ACEPOZ_10975 [Marinifilaceae bacterium]|jgi:hypothetical protein
MRNYKADVKNPNWGTNGTNRIYDQNQGNRGKQLNPNQEIRKAADRDDSLCEESDMDWEAFYAFNYD